MKDGLTRAATSVALEQPAATWEVKLPFDCLELAYLRSSATGSDLLPSPNPDAEDRPCSRTTCVAKQRPDHEP